MNPMTWRRIGSLTMVLAIASGGSQPAAQNGSQFREWKATALADAVQVKPRAACPTLVALTGYEFSVITATTVAASADAPEHCRIVGQIQPEIRFEVSLPAAWNGRLYVFGNGGYAGESLDAPNRAANVRRGLAHGFAVLQMNTGRRCDRAARQLRRQLAEIPRLCVSRPARQRPHHEEDSPDLLRRSAAAFLLRRLFDRRAAGPDRRAAFSRGLRRHRERRTGAEFLRHDDRLCSESACPSSLADPTGQVEDPL